MIQWILHVMSNLKNNLVVAWDLESMMIGVTVYSGASISGDDDDDDDERDRGPSSTTRIIGVHME